MHSISLIANDIVSLFNKQQNATQRLLDTLKKEYACLSNNDITSFEKLVSAKQQCATDLENLEYTLFQLLGKADYDTSSKGLRDFLSDIDGNREFTKVSHAWSSLLSVALECNEQNVINARVINAASLSVKQTLKLLNGQNSDDELYGKSGKTLDGGGSHSVTIA